jgi:hypothetical protein
MNWFDPEKHLERVPSSSQFAQCQGLLLLDPHDYYQIVVANARPSSPSLTGLLWRLFVCAAFSSEVQQMYMSVWILHTAGTLKMMTQDLESIAP